MNAKNVIQCTKCRKFIPTNSTFCLHCGAKVEKPEDLLGLLPEKYRNTYGTWQVTTEGDCEGRTTMHLGTFEGHVDKIARSLVGQAMYGLRFTAVAPVTEIPEPKTAREEVHVSFDIDSKTWDMVGEKRTKVMTELFKDRPVTIDDSNYYACFLIRLGEEE